MMQKFKKKPVVIEAMQLSSQPGQHGDKIAEWKEVEALGKGVHAIGNNVSGEFECLCINIKTLEGVITVMPGDWIIKGIKGELYPCKPDIFDETYECCDNR